MINKIEQLKSLKGELTFEAEGFYPGLADEQSRGALINLFDNIVDEFISGAQQDFKDEDYIGLIASNIVKFDSYGLDTEDREYVCYSFEKIMDAIGLESSGGALNEWMYGFDFNNIPSE